jgi:hypothetical protein
MLNDPVYKKCISCGLSAGNVGSLCTQSTTKGCFGYIRLVFVRILPTTYKQQEGVYEPN